MTDRSKITTLTRSLLLVAAALVLNIALGHLVQYVLQWPLYLDSVGTILVGALLGPLAGAATGALSIVIWSVWPGDPSTLPYAITAAFIGWAAGVAASHSAFQRLRTVALAGQRLEDVRTLFDQVFADADTLYNLMLASSTDTTHTETRLVAQIWPETRELQLYTCLLYTSRCV